MLKLLRRIFSKLNYLFFVGSTDILPEPFSKEEEEKYVNMFLNGDMNARDKLIEHNLRLVVFLAKKYENTKIDLEDLVSIGTIGLIKGVNTYQNDKNIKLATYASNNLCIISLDRLSLSESTVTHKSILILPFSVSFISKLVIVLLFSLTISLIILVISFSLCSSAITLKLYKL